jgi:hypothetical protein
VDIEYQELPGKGHWWWDTAAPNDGGSVNDPALRSFMHRAHRGGRHIVPGGEGALESTAGGGGEKGESVKQKGKKGKNGNKGKKGKKVAASAAAGVDAGVGFELVTFNPASSEGRGGLQVLQQRVPSRRSRIVAHIVDGGGGDGDGADSVVRQTLVVDSITNVRRLQLDLVGGVLPTSPAVTTITLPPPHVQRRGSSDATRASGIGITNRHANRANRTSFSLRKLELASAGQLCQFGDADWAPCSDNKLERGSGSGSSSENEGGGAEGRGGGKGAVKSEWRRTERGPGSLGAAREVFASSFIVVAGTGADDVCAESDSGTISAALLMEGALYIANRYCGCTRNLHTPSTHPPHPCHITASLSSYLSRISLSASLQSLDGYGFTHSSSYRRTATPGVQCV